MLLWQWFAALVVAASCLLTPFHCVTAAAATAPQNVTVTIVDAKTVRVFWATKTDTLVDKFDVAYKPTEANYRVVTVVAGNSAQVTLSDLEPDTQYQVTVAAVRGGARARSRPVVFRTLALVTEPTSVDGMSSTVVPLGSVDELNPDPTAVGSRYTPLTSITVRGVEISLVLLALVVWVFAISLFFHRWGKIRMLLPYQPDYKTQQSLKVPGSGAAGLSGCTADPSGHSDARTCVQQLRWSSRYFDDPGRPPSRWASRSRLPCGAISGSCTSLVLSVPTIPHARSTRGSIASIIDCLRRPPHSAASDADNAETQPLFVIEPASGSGTDTRPNTTVVKAEVMEETPLVSNPPASSAARYHRSSLKKQKTSLNQPLLTAEELKRKTLQRKISLQDTYINYNQDYWLQYDRSARFHTSLDLGYFCKNMPDQGPTLNAQKTLTVAHHQPRQLTTATTHHRLKPRKFLRGDSEPFIRLPSLTKSPSNENLPFCNEQNDDSNRQYFSQLENESSDPQSLSLRTTSSEDFSDVVLNAGGQGYFEAVPSSSNDSFTCEEHFNVEFEGSQRRASVPMVSVTRPSNSPSPRANNSPNSPVSIPISNSSVNQSSVAH